jgi:acylphosphatase
MIIRAHLNIYGKVTGVGFRAWISSKAKGMGINGLVKNTSDTTIEVTLEGEEQKVRELIILCNKGPNSAEVEKIDSKEEKVIINRYDRFQISY